MNDERPEAFMMIGLHKLAAQNGDGLVPELYALLTRRADMLESENVAEFPLASARPPARAASFEGASALEARNDNVVAFPQPRRLRRDSL
ncbi:hypothetical protein AB3G45_11135 [Shinella sp. S4-D37]|uniref:hypothetical protein n=1 Tax=Shinella sp. S4-D37 TaxID=3161999 RepID=UPI003467682D